MPETILVSGFFCQYREALYAVRANEYVGCAVYADLLYKIISAELF